MKTNLEITLPKSKTTYYFTIVLEIFLVVSVAILAIVYYRNPIFIIALIGLYGPIQKLLRPQSIYINGEGITIKGLKKAQETSFYKWTDISAISLHDNSRIKYQQGEIIIYINNPSEQEVRIELAKVYDLKDQFYIGKYSNRIKEPLKELCYLHGIKIFLS